MISRHEALAIGEIVRDKIRKGSNAYALFFQDGKIMHTRDNSTIFCKWEVSGNPLLIGRYTSRASAFDIADDILSVAGE